MRLALDAARAARGRTSPNPWVGAAVVRDGVVISTGLTQPTGGAHAEADALAGVDARGATVYVTLEPCAPFEGKRTPSCAAALVAAGVARVVVALEDPDVRVRGAGLALLRKAGVVVELGDGGAESGALLRPYVKHRATGLPYVIAKFAATLDGRTATSTGDSKWITGEAARDRGHQERAWVDAIMVGSGTVLADDPSLTARPGGVLAGRQPVRVVLDARGRVAPTAAVFERPGTAIVATTAPAPRAWRRAVAATGAQLVDCEPELGTRNSEPGTGHGLNLDQLLQTLGQRGIMSVWAEGGGTLLGSLFDGGHVDEVWAFIAPVILGGAGARPAVGGLGVDRVAYAWGLRETVVERLGEDILVRGYVGDWGQ